MHYFTFTGDADGNEATYSFQDALNILDNYFNKPAEILAHLKKGIIKSITVPDGKFTLHKFQKKIPINLNKIPYSRN